MFQRTITENRNLLLSILNCSVYTAIIVIPSFLCDKATSAPRLNRFRSLRLWCEHVHYVFSRPLSEAEASPSLASDSASSSCASAVPMMARAASTGMRPP
mmetsp:Transcript_1925/g.3576  ORF Transcript_1925/g.3576 Transcript_1925/m.3576 type:complete len:100 (+) Transcript_1925:161-460(+)